VDDFFPGFIEHYKRPMSVVAKLKTMGWGVFIFFTVKGLFTLYFGAKLLEYFTAEEATMHEAE
jgi:hypothetical protein